MSTSTIASQLLKNVMTGSIETIAPTAPLQEAAQKMRDLDVGALPVCDGTYLQGMLTDRDIVVRLIA
jgi:CBS domain-containing protein